MRIHILTIFPEMFADVFRCGIVRRAVDNGLVQIEVVDLRGFTHDIHRTVDDRPYGGGAGMVMKPEPICEAIDNLTEKLRARPYIVLLSAQGQLFSQMKASCWTSKLELLLICGRYEGVDERIAMHVADEEVSVGDYVVSGGEIPTMLLIDAVVRLLPGVLGNDESIEADSFSKGILGWPSFTRPADYRGWRVPEVLLSGDHQRIDHWRRAQALAKTSSNRPSLLGK